MERMSRLVLRSGLTPRRVECASSNSTAVSWAQLGRSIEGSESNWYWFGWKLTMSTVGKLLARRCRLQRRREREQERNRSVYQVSRMLEDMAAVGADIVEEISEMRAGFSLDSPTKVAHLAVGSAFNSNTGGESAGHVRIYKYDSGWTELGYGINGSNAYDYLGSSLALANDDADGAEDGLIVAVGAPGASGNRGLVAVYEFDGTEWQQMGATFLAITTGTNLDSQCRSRTMGRDSLLVPNTPPATILALFEFTIGKQIYLERLPN